MYKRLRALTLIGLLAMSLMACGTEKTEGNNQNIPKQEKREVDLNTDGLEKDNEVPESGKPRLKY
ncbi:hypothetical protein IGM_01958 [Bacillus cereus HuB4-4]|uniref:Lipoprotein n=1 Tax=Bacillus cereus HuB4-4 TaxID=1053211 RepID=A0A9W5QWK8_BACCE|nr:hypothetical protein [Bacillus cereus]EOP91898.1 hypothetical protein IGM_01958 [Bacillus cereus HuB4-4]